MKNYELLEMMLSTPSPSGYELNLNKKIINAMKDVDDSVITMQDQNAIHVLNPKSKTKLLFLAHIDEVGLMINKINSDGTARVEEIGNPRVYCNIAQRGRALVGKKEVPCIITYLPNMDKGVKIRDLIVDFGTSSKEETEKLVSIGTPIVLDRDYTYLNEKRLCGRALDDKICAYIILEAMKRVKEKTNLGIYCCTSVGEETTSRGAKSAVYAVDPTATICLDVTYATDIQYRENLSGEKILGKGPVLCTGSIMNPIIDKKMVASCKKLGIPFQREVSPERSYTDTDWVYNHKGSTPAYLISIALRYMHSSVELVDLDDVESIIQMLVEFILSYKEGMSFNPFDEEDE